MLESLAGAAALFDPCPLVVQRMSRPPVAVSSIGAADAQRLSQRGTIFIDLSKFSVLTHEDLGVLSAVPKRDALARGFIIIFFVCLFRNASVTTLPEASHALLQGAQ